MRPLSVAERVRDAPTVSLAALLAGPTYIEGETDWTLPDYVHEIVASGFPGIRGLPDRAQRLAPDGYLTRIVDRDMAEQGKAPKHHLADPALAARLMELDKGDLLGARGHSMLGAQPGAALGRLFESLVTLSAQTYAQAIEARLWHFRDQAGLHEVDLIVEARNRVVAIEVKLAASVTDNDVKHLRWLRDRIGDRLADAVVVTTGHSAYRRTDGIAVVPLALFGP